MDTTTEGNALQEIVAQAYQAFRVKPPPDLSVCTDGCCMPAEAERRALKAGQSNIALHDLREWQHAAFDPENGRAAVRWVLPRTLEWLVDGEELNRVDPSLTLKRLAITGFPDGYRSEEVVCLNAFAVTYTQHLLHQAVGRRQGFVLDDMLCMIANAGVDLSPVIQVLEASPIAEPSLVCRKATTFMRLDLPLSGTIQINAKSPLIGIVPKDWNTE